MEILNNFFDKVPESKIQEAHLLIPISMVMEIYKELSYLTSEASNAKLAERLLKLVKGETE